MEKDRSRFKTIVAGRRSGKSLYVCKEEIVTKELFEADKTIWVVGPNYDLAGRIWDILYGLAINELRDYVEYINNSRGMYMIRMPWGTTIEAKSADDPKTLVGKGIDLLVVDEAAIMKEKAWKESLMPALIDRQGRAVFIGTPKGKNWFYQNYIKGQDPENKDFVSWRFSSYENNTIKKSEIDSIAVQMDQTERKQEISAEFIEGAGQVFRNIAACIKGQFEEWKENNEYVAGVDLAKHKDFTVIKVIRVDTKQVVFTDRFNQLDWGVQKTRIKTALDRYNNPRCFVDSTGVGDSVYDDLVANNLNVEPYRYTESSKLDLIKNLSVMLENEKIYIPVEDKQCINELEIFQYEQTPSGKFRYNAPEGMHDDEVNALMLAAWGLKNQGGIEINFL